MNGSSTLPLTGFQGMRVSASADGLTVRRYCSDCRCSSDGCPGNN